MAAPLKQSSSSPISIPGSPPQRPPRRRLTLSRSPSEESLGSSSPLEQTITKSRSLDLFSPRNRLPRSQCSLSQISEESGRRRSPLHRLFSRRCSPKSVSSCDESKNELAFNEKKSACIVYGAIDLESASSIGDVDPISEENLKYASLYSQNPVVRMKFAEFCKTEEITEFPEFSKTVKKIEGLIQTLDEMEKSGQYPQNLEDAKRVGFIKIHHRYIKNVLDEPQGPFHLNGSCLNIESQLIIKTHKIVAPFLYENFQDYLKKEQIKVIFNAYMQVIRQYEDAPMWKERLGEFCKKYNKGKLFYANLLVSKWD